MSEKTKIDARSFIEIWNSLTDLEIRGMREILNREGVSDDALMNWRKGKSIPRKPYIKIIISALKTGGYSTTPETLFPVK